MENAVVVIVSCKAFLEPVTEYNRMLGMLGAATGFISHKDRHDLSVVADIFISDRFKYLLSCCISKLKCVTGCGSDLGRCEIYAVISVKTCNDDVTGYFVSRIQKHFRNGYRHDIVCTDNGIRKNLSFKQRLGSDTAGIRPEIAVAYHCIVKGNVVFGKYFLKDLDTSV